jgi:hypothetical protein
VTLVTNEDMVDGGLWCSLEVVQRGDVVGDLSTVASRRVTSK